MADLTTLLSQFLDDLYAGTLGTTWPISGVTVTDAGAVQFGTTTPAVLSRGAANRLDLASGDSLYLESGGLGVATTPGSAGTIAATGTISTTNGNFTATNGTLSVAAIANTGSVILGALTAGSATSTKQIIKKVTGIADNTATDVLTVTVPNANHAAVIKLTLLSSNGSTDAFESSRTAEGAVVVARTTGANAVAVAATLTLAQIATVAAGATHTLAYGVSAISGAVGATNTFTIQVTIDDSGNLGSNQCVVLAEVINAEATGVTIA